MKIQELVQQSRTKVGEVTFQYQTDTEMENRGFTIDKVTAHLDGKQVGYLKISYVPREKFFQFYPTILNFKDQIEGWSILPWEKKTWHYKDLDPGERRDLLKNFLLYSRTTMGIDVSSLSDREVLATIKQLEEKMMKEDPHHKRGFHWFRRYFVNKTFVDFIRVEDEYKGKGIGAELYKAGAQWMKERGMRLYASGIQSDDAKAAWSRLAKQITIKRDRRGKYLAV